MVLEEEKRKRRFLGFGRRKKEETLVFLGEFKN